VTELSIEEPAEVNAVAAAAILVPDYDYYQANFNDGYCYRTGLPIARSGNLIQTAVLLFWWAILD
jgi:hypothetical protein